MSIQRKLESHLQEKYVNHFWLEKVLHEKYYYTFFPYEPADRGAKVEPKVIVPKNASLVHPTGSQGKPLFLVNIPVAHLPTSTGYGKIHNLLSSLKTESFAENDLHSSQQAKRKLAVVIGVNQIKSIDANVNRAFEKYIGEVPVSSDIPHQVFGFFWVPKWVTANLWKDERIEEVFKKKRALASKVYEKGKAFLLVKCIDPRKGLLLRSMLEGHLRRISASIRRQIPFQRIREVVLKSEATLAFAKEMAKKSSSSPVFFVTMDGDSEKLRTQKKGYFSTFEDVILGTKKEKGFLPSVVSLGYQLSDNALPIPRFAVKCDMMVRKAMNDIIPGSVYMPEPGTAYYLSAEGKLLKSLHQFSFVDTKKKDKNAFESRRAIANGIKSGIIDQTKMVFEYEGGLQTAMPSRMVTEVVKKYDVLKPADFKKKEVLQALRGVSQVHFTPLDWSHYLYEGLPSSVKKGSTAYGKISGILAKIFNVFDPISFIYNFPSNTTFSRKVAICLKLHEAYTENLIDGERDNEIVVKRNQPHLKLKEELKPYDAFIQGQFSLLLNAKKDLLAAGLTDEWITKVIDAARASGKVLASQLTNASQVE